MCAHVLLMALAAATTASAETVSLLWDPSPDVSVVGYVVYVGAESGVYTTTYDVGRSTSFVFTDALAGRPYYFAVAAYAPGPLVGPLSREVSSFTNAPPVLSNPGDQTTAVGQPIALQLAGHDPEGQPVTYSAAGLPPGVVISTSTGLISGTPTAAGTYPVTATVSDGASFDTESFTWTTVPPLRDITPPVVTITSPTSLDTYTTQASHVLLGGTAVDDVAVASVSWTNDRGGSGGTTGTSAWIAGVLLHPGQNRIVVTARDSSGNARAVTIVVHRYAIGL